MTSGIGKDATNVRAAMSSSSAAPGVVERVQNFVAENKKVVLIGAAVAAVAIGGAAYYASTSDDASRRKKKKAKSSKKPKSGDKPGSALQDDGPILEEIESDTGCKGGRGMRWNSC